jgi:alkylation response protein AidB-like acyl-CoA dehydrogenase
MSLLDFERSNITTAVSLRKNMEQLLENVKSPATARQIVGGGLQRERLMVAQHYIETEVLFNFGFRIVSMQSAGLHPNHEASASKIFSSELTQRLSNTAMKVYGLYSNVWDSDDEYSPQRSLFTIEYVQSVVLTIFGGSNEIQRNIIATRGLGLPRG